MNSLKTILVSVAMICLCNACNNENILSDGNADGSVKFNAEVQQAITRSGNGTTLYAGTSLTLWYGSVKTGTSAEYTSTAGDGIWTASTPLYWDHLTPNQDNKYSFSALAGTSTLNANATGGSVAEDQSINDGYNKADMLAAFSETSARRQTLAFTLKHLMAQVTIVLKNTDNASTAFTEEQLRTASATMSSLNTDYTTSFTSSACSVTAGTGTPTDVKLCPDASNATSSSTMTYRGILPAQTVGSMTVMIDGKPYTINIDHSINAGENTVQTLIASKTGIQLGNVSVSNWIENDLGNANLAINITNNSGSDNTNFSLMYLWKNKGTNVDDDMLQGCAYKKDNNIWSFDIVNEINKSKSDFKLDDITSTDCFYAAANNCNADGTIIEDQQTGSRDIIAVGPISPSQTASGCALNLEFHHVYAQMTLVIKAGTNFPTTISLSGATITTPTIKNNVQLVYDAANGNIINTPQTVTTMVRSLSTTYDSGKNESSVTVIIDPQTISKESKFIVTLANGNKYTATLANDVEIKNDCNNALTLILAPTTAKVGTVSVAEWGTGSSAAADAALDGIIIPTETLSGINHAGFLVMATTTGSVNGLYPITYTEGTASINTSSTYYNPILWDQLASGGKYSYNAFFDPSTVSSGNQERDYLTTTTSGTDWGTTPKLELKHAMGLLTLKLQCTDGTYTGDQLKSALLNFNSTISYRGYYPNTAEIVLSDKYTNTVTMTNAGTTNDNFGTYTAIVAPQTLTGITFSIADKTFTLTKDITLTANQNYTLTATVSKTALKIGTITVSNWTAGASAEGTLEY